MTILSTRLLHKITMLPMALIMLGAWLFAGSAWSQTTAPQLFGAPFLTLTTTQERNATRTRQVSVDTSLLTARAAEIGSSKLTPQEITLNLFDDVQLIADLVRIERTRNGVAWIGRVRDAAFSQVTFVTLGSIVAGNIVTPAARYQIRHVESGVHEVRANETPPSTATQSVTGTSTAVPRSTSTTTLSASTADTIVGAASADNGATIDVMVVYSETAATAAGSEANLLADIDLAVTDLNVSFQESDVDPRVRLVHTEKVAYTETTLTKALEDITGTTDTVLDTIHALRTTKGADIVSFWVAGDSVSDDECGLAWSSVIEDAYAFNVVKSVCAAESNYYGFAHQLGHTMGAGHDAYSGGSGAIYDYSHGYTLPEAGVRTIMAMSNECQACFRVPMWSNPSITIGGLPLGDAATADNHRTLNERALTVAGFRTSIAIELQQNVALTDLYGAANSEMLYKITVPANATNLVIETSSGTGDVDLYIRQGSAPDTTTYACKSDEVDSNTETCTVFVPTAGDWYIMLKGYTEYAGVTLLANYDSLVTLSDNVAATPLSGTTGSQKYFKITVPSGQKRLVITTSGGTGNADLYASQGTYPTIETTTTANSCASTTASSNAETCTITSPAAGDWYIMLKGTAEYSDLSLLANYSAANITPILMLLLE